MMDGIPNRPLYFYQKDMIAYVYIYIYIHDMLHVQTMKHILNLLLAIGVFITCLCKRINNVEPRVWALSPPLLCYSI